MALLGGNHRPPAPAARLRFTGRPVDLPAPAVLIVRSDGGQPVTARVSETVARLRVCRSHGASMSIRTAQTRHPAITAASLLCFIIGAGWSIGSPSSIVYMIRNRSLAEIGQIRGMSGPFEALGIDTMILLALLFYAINLVFIVAGYWLWKSYRKGGILGISLLALSVVFWWGFALPLFPVVGLLIAALLAAGWKSLRAGTVSKPG